MIRPIRPFRERTVLLNLLTALFEFLVTDILERFYADEFAVPDYVVTCPMDRYE